MKQQHVSHLLSEYIDSLLETEQQKAFERHIEECEQCRNELAAFRSLVKELNTLPTSIDPPQEVINAVEKKMRSLRKQAHGRFSKSITVGKIAATLVVLLGAGVISRFVFFTESAPKKVVAPHMETEALSIAPLGDIVLEDDVFLYEPTERADAHGALYKVIPPEDAERFNTEDYNKIDENEFKDALSNPLSTFSIDVDAASYSNVRRFIKGGQLPPKDAVRIEEMINYFSYDYPQPKDKHPFSVNTEFAVCPWNLENSLLLIGLKGKEYSADQLAPSNLVFLIDVSGSMDDPAKLPLVQAAFRLLTQRLRPQDRVAIVVYAGNAGLVLPSTPGSDKETILEAVDRLSAGGSTAGGAGIRLAYKIARENFLNNGNNRVILATDGDFNIGVSSDGELVRMIEDERRDGIYLSVLGFGTGNYKDSKMEQLADKGNGNYAYIDDIHEARRVLVGQMAGTLYAIAKDVKIQIEFNPAIVKSYRLIGYENRLLNKEDFKDDKKDAGELGVGHTVTALYELVLNEGSQQQNPDSLKYQTSVVNPESFRTNEALTLKLRYKPPTDTVSILMTTPVLKNVARLAETSKNFRFASSVAMFGMILRDSKFKERASYDEVLRLAKDAQPSELDSYKLEFIQLVETCRLLGERRGE